MKKYIFKLNQTIERNKKTVNKLINKNKLPSCFTHIQSRAQIRLSAMTELKEFYDSLLIRPPVLNTDSDPTVVKELVTCLLQLLIM